MLLLESGPPAAMEAIENSQCDQSSVDTIDLIECHQSEKLDILIETFSRHRINDEEDDQGICLSGSSSPTEFTNEDLCPAEDDFDSTNPLSEELVELIEGLVIRNTMALDLRKNTNNKIQEHDESKNEFSDEDNTEALDLTASARKTTLGPPPPLAPLIPSQPSDAIKQLSNVEKDMLRQSYHRLVRFLRMDLPNRQQQFTEEYRTMALRKLQSFLLMYLIEVKKKSPAGLKMFQDSFGSDLGIRQFFRVFLGKSEQLTRSSSLPTHPTGFGTDDAAPQILCRGPGHERQHNRMSSINNAPYPLRRTDSGHHPYAGGSTSYGHRGSHLSYQSPYSPPQQGYLHPPNVWYQNPSTCLPLPSQNPAQGAYRHPQPPYDNTSGSCLEVHFLTKK